MYDASTLVHKQGHCHGWTRAVMPSSLLTGAFSDIPESIDIKVFQGQAPIPHSPLLFSPLYFLCVLIAAIIVLRNQILEHSLGVSDSLKGSGAWGQNHLLCPCVKMFCYWRLFFKFVSLKILYFKAMPCSFSLK